MFPQPDKQKFERNEKETTLWSNEVLLAALTQSARRSLIQPMWIVRDALRAAASCLPRPGRTTVLGECSRLSLVF